MVTRTINGTTYDSDSSFNGYDYVPAVLALAGDIMIESDARSGALAHFTFSTTTADADPGAGLLRLNQATQNTATEIYVDLLDADGATVTDLLDSFDDSTSTVKGLLTLRQRNDRTKWLIFRLTAVTSASGYRKLTVSAVGQSSASPFANGAPLSLSFDATGDKGDINGGTLAGNIDANGFDITDVGDLSVGGALTISASTFSAPGIPAVLAHVGTGPTNVTGDGTSYTVIFDTEVYDQGADYNNATGIFTAPTAGIYHVCGTLRISGMTANNTRGAVAIVASNRTVAVGEQNPYGSRSGDNRFGFPFALDVDMDAGDTVRIRLTVTATDKGIDIDSTDANYLSVRQVA